VSAGKLSDQIGARTVIFIGYIVLIGSYVLLDLADGAWTLAQGFLIFGLFPALTDGVQRSLASQLTEGVRGGGLGWLNASVGFGALASGIGGRYLWQAYGPTLAFAACAAIVLAGLVFLAVSARGGASPSH
jgi:predicted MFS family arabinose efflux permease